MSWVGPVEWGALEPPAAKSLPALLEQLKDLSGNSEAIVAGDVRLTYTESYDQANAFAAALASMGVTPETRIALLAPNSEAWLIAAFGALRLGVTLHMFHTWVRARDLDYLLNAARTEVLITVPQVRSNDVIAEMRSLIPDHWELGFEGNEQFTHLKNVVLIGESETDTPAPKDSVQFVSLIDSYLGAEVPQDQAKSENAACVLYTSGTTEYPKAVPLRHRDLVENGFSIGERMGLVTGDSVWLGSPLFWSFGVANAVMATMTHAGCLVLQERFTPADAAALMAKEQCTAAYLLPSIALALIEESQDEMRAISSLRTGLTIGRPEEVRNTMEKLGISELCNIYGSTEVYGNCCVTPHTYDAESRILTQGPPLHGVEVRIVDTESNELLPLGETGEIQIRGRVMAGYLANPESTQQVLTDDGWYRSGDLGTLDDNGNLRFVSRHSDMIKTSGINVSPSEVEAFLSTLDNVEEVVVVGAPHPERGEVPIAFVTATTVGKLHEAEILAECRKYIASFKVPWAIEIIDEIPMTATGKVTRQTLVPFAAEIVEERLRAQQI